MDELTPKLTRLIDLTNAAIAIVIEMQSSSSSANSPESLDQTILILNDLKERAYTGRLGSSADGVILGLVRYVSDWIEPLNSPLLSAVGEIEIYFRDYFRSPD